ncbi:insulin-like growth factor 3 isoform X2 [Epinephelus fuscoguttatus]|uniref:insulin-like growth factor 3 isoform X2 n=1 Tax=Epinephelus fuscoguttatus TaxID=293821 RepID=UPI0020D1BA93|nr:insulin-like growth factor 3 isoform X2 [Epinephelus fuscoguttatus]
MCSACCPAATPQTLKVFCVWVCMFYSTMCLAAWPLSSEAAKLRCGSDLLSDLIFVCGDRGIYLGKGTWSGYGTRPRGKGIVDQCCRPAGCELQHLEMYCAKPKSQQHTTAYPATTTALPTTTLADTVVRGSQGGIRKIKRSSSKQYFKKDFLNTWGPPTDQRGKLTEGEHSLLSDGKTKFHHPAGELKQEAPPTGLP